MEFEDIKALWDHSSVSDPTYLKMEDFEEKLSSVLKQKNRIKLSFRIELLVTAGIYTGFIITVLLFGKSVQSYLFKMVGIVTVIGVPVFIRLYKSIQWRENLDYSRDIKSYLAERVNYFKKTLRFYRWASYSIIMMTIVAFFTDASFNKLPLYLKCIIVAYLAVFVFLVGPYTKKMYGDKVALMEDVLNG
jgi:hypothetical protein